MKIEELVGHDLDFIDSYRHQDNYLEIVKQQGTYETYTSWYIRLENEQYQRVFNKDNYEAYLVFETFFKEHYFEDVITNYISSKQELHVQLTFQNIHSSDINKFANTGAMFGKFLMDYPNFTMQVSKDGFIVLESIIALYDRVKIKDHSQMLEELRYRIDLLRNIEG